MLSKKIEAAMNKQLNAELYAAYLYLSMSTYFENINLGGFAHWMRAQAHEEISHAMKFYDHINERRGRISLTAIAAPPTSWKSPLHAFQDAFHHEEKVTGMINTLVNMARAEKDYPAETMLHWFVDEQVEEEQQTDEIVQKLKMIGNHTGSLFMLNRELGARKED